MGKIDIKVKMMAAVAEALKYRKGNPSMEYGRIMQHISDMVRKERNQHTQLGMIAAASKALTISEKEPRLKEREVMKRVMEQLPEILEKIG
jgi:hypothetical protein